MLKLMLEDIFPRIWIRSPENGDLCQLIWHRRQLARMRTWIMKQLHTLATVIQVFENAYTLEEPSVNTMKCPIHGTYLYRREDKDSEPAVR
jgi:hypothetical protein